MMLVIKSKGLTEELQNNLDALEKDSLKVVDKDQYIIPEHIQPGELSKARYYTYRILGILLKPFRYII